jgi:hypothetical protein
MTPRASAPAGSDDEGVIDLKALASSPPPRPMPFGVGMPVAPLFSEPPPVTLEVDEGQKAKARRANRLALIGGIAAAAVFVAVAGFGISIAFRGEEPVKHAPAAIVLPPPPSVVTAPPAAAEPPPPVATDDSSDTKETKKKKRRGKSGLMTTKSAAPAAKAPKVADPCGCHGDLNCILACTFKGGG